LFRAFATAHTIAINTHSRTRLGSTLRRCFARSRRRCRAWTPPQWQRRRRRSRRSSSSTSNSPRRRWRRRRGGVHA